MQEHCFVDLYGTSGIASEHKPASNFAYLVLLVLALGETAQVHDFLVAIL